ncbi:MAG: DUF736 domain-containing protein [Pseudomonadota bacterium]
MQIGSFTKTDSGEFEGRITTLTLSADIRYLPVSDKPNDRVPDFRIVSADSETEIGAGWFKKAKESGKSYVSSKIDDPSFPAPIWAALFSDEHGNYALYWDRPNPSASDPVSSSDKENF